MLAGIQELLTIGLIILCLFFLPRLFRGTQSNYHKKVRPESKISGKMRLGIVISFLLPVTMIFLFKPWEGDLILFISVGILPVALGWAGLWVKDGFKIKGPY